MVIETLFLGGVGVIAGVVSIPYFGYIGYVYKFKVFDLFKYKREKRHLYKKIHKAILEQDIQSLRDYLRSLGKFDSKYGRTKLPALKKKLGINDEILNDRKLFKMKFDSDFLVEQALNIHCTNGDLNELEQELKNKEKDLQSYEGYDNIRRKEQELIEKEKVLNEREEEIREIIQNIAKL